MALNWNAKAVKGREDFTEWEFKVLDAMIWLTMAVGMYKITDSNWKEFHARIQFIERLHTPMMSKDGKDYFITEEDVKRCIGLQTNASTFTRHQFNKIKVDNFYKERGL